MLAPTNKWPLLSSPIDVSETQKLIRVMSLLTKNGYVATIQDAKDYLAKKKETEK